MRLIAEKIGFFVDGRNRENWLRSTPNNGQKPKVLHTERKKRNEKNPIHLNDNSKCNGVSCVYALQRWFTLRLFVCVDVKYRNSSSCLQQCTLCVCAIIVRKTNPKLVSSFRLCLRFVCMFVCFYTAFLTFVTKTPLFDCCLIRIRSHTPADITPTFETEFMIKLGIKFNWNQFKELKISSFF